MASLVENCNLNELGCGACRCLGIINVNFYYNYLASSIDDDGIIYFGDFAARHVKVSLYDVESLMFLRILNPVFIGDKVFNRALLTSSYLKIPTQGG